MRATAQSLDGRVTQEIGRVERVDEEVVDSAFVIATNASRLRCARAVSCVVAPELQDTVLVAVSETGAAWVLAVLERPTEAPQRWMADRDVELVSRGTLRLEGEEGLDVRSKGGVSLVSRLLEVRAVDARAFAERLGLSGAVAKINLTRLESVVGFCDQVLERFTQTVKRSYRFVEEMDVTRARQVDLRAEENVSVRARNTLMTSEVLMKVDADQIHLG